MIYSFSSRVFRAGSTFSLFLVIFLFSACKGGSDNDQNVAGSGPVYFSLEDFFNQEINRLQADSGQVFKTVEINESKESKWMENINWQTEFTPFLTSDINKSAWINSYNVDSNATYIHYSALEPGLQIREIRIHRSPDGRISFLLIEKQVSNWIYSAYEKLSYYPDSAYEIIKEQKIRIVGDNYYRINGEWNPRETD